jgi:hypothetical protein
MHHIMLAKIRASSAKEALNQVTELFNETCEDGNHDGWDYVSGIDQVKTSTPYTSWEGLEDEYKKAGEAWIVRKTDMMKKELFIILTGLCLSKRESILYVTHEDQHVKEIVERLLKSDEDRALPSSFEELVETFSKALLHSIHSGGMLSYYFKAVQKYHDASGDVASIIRCNDKHFVDLGGKGRVYYFFIDRHY